jgi:hypothetical protein
MINKIGFIVMILIMATTLNANTKKHTTKMVI